VLDLPHESGAQQLLDLEVDELLALERLLPDLLLDGLGARTDREVMLNHFPRDPGHVGRLPCKHVDIRPEESDEHEFLFGSQASAYAGDLGGLRADLHHLRRDLLGVVGLCGTAGA